MPDPLDPNARLSLFGHDPTPARVLLVPRTKRWRALRALRVLAVGLVAAPLLALVPPHAPWALGALGAAGIIALRRWQEAYTVAEAEGVCPRCGEDVEVRPGVRLQQPHPVACEGCHHEAALEVDLPDAEGAS